MLAVQGGIQHVQPLGRPYPLTLTAKMSTAPGTKAGSSWSLPSKSCRSEVEKEKALLGRRLFQTVSKPTTKAAGTSLPFSQPKPNRRVLAEKNSNEEPGTEKVEVDTATDTAKVPEEGAWGPLFKNREHFVEMHFC